MKSLQVITIIIVVNIINVIFSPAIQAQVNLDDVNQKVCNRFEEDLNRLAAIMEELRRRKGITETRVAFGGVDTPIENADYWITYGAEAMAFQRAQKYSSTASLKSDLRVLAGKVLRAKAEVGKALNAK
ncbi:MAG: Uncharacterized protein G01um10147_167 [Microgenomates group bacterium Gr01-1014_7]|nr:MAG: Uncharacterized protein G01um10147_167 [Microgenomates group bacterium Gr01-1014_7]